MFWHKVVNDGSVPLKYKEGKRTKKEYRSKCLSYKFNIPKGFVLGNEHQLKDRSTPKDICDLIYCNLALHIPMTMQRASRI